MNEAQMRAVTTRVPTVLVSAGAGSGKTMVLTQRYFHLLTNQRVKTEQILTLTFTRKAAQEMRERIARELDAAGMAKERRELARAPIGTIHSYCERVLREHALEAGIDPNFRLLDEVETHTLEEKTLDAVFAEVWDGPQHERAEIGRLLLDMPHRELRGGLLAAYRHARTHGLAIDALHPLPGPPLPPLADAVRAAVAHLLGLRDAGTANWRDGVDAAARTADALAALLAADDFTWEAHDAAAALVPRLCPNGGPKETAKAARDGIKAAVAAWQAAGVDAIVQPYLRAFHTLLARFDALYTEEKRRRGLLDMADLLLVTDALLAAPHAAGTRARYQRQFRQVMVDEFQDTNPLQARIIHALRGDGDLFLVGDVKQSIYRFIGSDVHVFLDHQRDIAALGDAGQRIAMHANYRTRPEVLDPLNGLFARLWPSAPQNAMLPKTSTVDGPHLQPFSPRGRGSDGADSQSLSLPLGGKGEGWGLRESAPPDDGFFFEPLTAGMPFAPVAEPAVEAAFWPYEGASADELRDREAAWIARRILQLTGAIDGAPLAVAEGDGTRPATFRDVILLFRASTDIPRHEHALRAAGIPFYVVSGRGFYQAPEVQDLLRLLQVVENPMDDFALAVTLRSPLAGVSDDTLFWLSRDWSAWAPGDPLPDAPAPSAFHRLWPNVLRADALPLNPADQAALRGLRALVAELQELLPAGQPLDMLDLILARTRYLACLLAADGGEQRVANVRKLREVAADFQARDIFDMADFGRYLSQLSEVASREASAPLDVEASDVVRLMTIHAAKGLEAPIVFVADGGRAPNKDYPTFLLTPEGGLTCKAPTPDLDWARSAAYIAALDAHAREERAQDARLLYVALTRARERLICSGFTKFTQGDTYADILAGLLGLTAAPDDDTDIAVAFNDTAYPVRVWAPASLAAVEAQPTPPQPPTLWEEYDLEIFRGEDLPVAGVDAAEITHFQRVIDRFVPRTWALRTGPLRLGVNRALCYHDCPRQYWYRHVLRQERIVVDPPMPTLAEESDEAVARTDGTAFGTLLHAVMQRVDFSRPLPAQIDGILAALPRLPVDADARAHLHACLGTPAATPLYAELAAATVQRELPFLARVDDVHMPGIIDALAHDARGWWIVDYKTGRRSARHMRQLYLYALGVEQAVGTPPSHLVLAYLDEGAIVSETLSPALLANVRELLLQAGRGIRDGHFAPTPGRVCAHCPFNTACGDALT
jgi:ATP-dependent helicase/nuclease subunit A